MDQPDFDLDDEQLRATGSIKWTYAGPGVLPAWVAEMDVAPCPAVRDALARAVDRGAFGYPSLDRDTDLPEATAAFLSTRFGWAVDPELVLSTGDVMAGLSLTLTTLCEPGAVVVPVPSYPPFLAAVPLAGRELVTVAMRAPTGGASSGGQPPGWSLDLERIDAALAAGARTVLLTNPHNPTGRAFSVAELEAFRDVVRRHAARVISDEIHAPLTLDGAVHTPYATLSGTGDHVTTLVAASKAWNLPGLKCAQIVAGSATDAAALRAVPHVANHGTSPLGVIAATAAYRDGVGWLDALLSHLQARREQFGRLLAEHLPDLTYLPPEATYLAWLDARPTGLADPAAAALARGKVMVNPGPDFGPGCEGFVRVNLATSPERLERVVLALASAWN